MIISILLLILSILLYFFAPEVYSYQYCNSIFVVYIVSSVWIIRRTKLNNNYFNFHVLFLISFLFVNFVYPNILYPISPEYFPVFKKSFNHYVITKASALALVGSCSYIFGICIQQRIKTKIYSKPNLKYKRVRFKLTIILFISFFVMIYFGGLAMFKGFYGSTSNIPSGLLVFVQVVIGLAVILILYSKEFRGTFVDFIKKFNKPVMFVLLGFIFIFIYTGDRGPAIQIALIILGLISMYLRPIKLKEFTLILAFGMVLLTFISYARAKSSSHTQSGVSGFVDRGINNIQLDSFFDVGMDLIVNNRNLYVGYDYANKNGVSYGKSMFHYIFSPIPMLPSFLTVYFFESPPADLTTAAIITKEAKSTYGLGTNIIADLYMSFGIVGVVFFMFLLGFIVSKFHRKAIYSNNINAVIIYTFLLGFSIYLPRTAILEPLRFIIWGVFLFNLLNWMSNIEMNKRFSLDDDSVHLL